jgi:transcriptional coactivator HFI1/ADA1
LYLTLVLDFDLEIRKRYTQPLAIESGEFPDMGLIAGRMLPFCYEAGLVNGHAPDASHLMSVATEAFIKEVLTQVFSRTQSNGPGDSGNAGYGIGTTWVQTNKYRRQLHREEDAALRGEISRDKSGLLPIESKAASERGPLGIADVRVALEMADSGISQFPIISAQVLYGYREGELENWKDYTWANGEMPVPQVEELITNGNTELTNGTFPDAMDIDNEIWWEGAEKPDMDMIDNALDSCLAVGS